MIYVLHSHAKTHTLFIFGVGVSSFVLYLIDFINVSISNFTHAFLFICLPYTYTHTHKEESQIELLLNAWKSTSANDLEIDISKRIVVSFVYFSSKKKKKTWATFKYMSKYLFINEEQVTKKKGCDNHFHIQICIAFYLFSFSSSSFAFDFVCCVFPLIRFLFFYKTSETNRIHTMYRCVNFWLKCFCFNSFGVVSFSSHISPFPFFFLFMTVFWCGGF